MNNSNAADYQSNYLPPADRCSDEALIEMAQIVKTFKNAAGEFTALNNVTACFYPGEFVSVVGKSGSGKSTLVNMITGIDHPTSGTVRVGECFVHKLSENDMSLWRGRNLGIVFQFFQLLPTMTLLENVMLPMYLAGLYTPLEREQRAQELLKLVGLADFSDKLPAAVSGGQQQSAAIARALATDPPILIADEPTGNLDSRTADEVFALFANLIERGKTILMVTHDAALASRTNRTLLISDGELIHSTVAAALPFLSHRDLLWLTRNLKVRNLRAGEPVFPVGTQLEGLALLSEGSLRITNGLSPTRTTGPVYLSELDPPPGNVTAGENEPATLLTLDRTAFDGWLQARPRARELLQQAAARTKSIEVQS